MPLYSPLWEHDYLLSLSFLFQTLIQTLQNQNARQISTLCFSVLKLGGHLTLSDQFSWKGDVQSI